VTTYSLFEDGRMTEDCSLADLRKKAHRLNCDLSDEDYDPREIEIIGYYLHRIAASYLSYQTHKEIQKSENESGESKKNPVLTNFETP
jgi:hypothetical protein